MKKANVLWCIRNLIFPVIFNVFFFVIGGVEHNVSVWLSYGFIHFAYFILLLTPVLLTRRGKSIAVFWFSLYYISAIYFIVEFIVGVTFILIAPESIKLPLLTQLGIAGLYGIVLITSMIANERTADVEEKRQPEIEYIKNASIKLRGLLDGVNDKETKRKIERVYDAIYSSPVKSHPNLTELENRIFAIINELETAVAAGNKEGMVSIAGSLLSLVNERNNLLKSFN